MNITDEIVNQVKISDNIVSSFKKFRSKLFKKKKICTLSTEDYKEFIKFIEKNAEFILKLNDLSCSEIVFFSNCFRKAKFLDINYIISEAIMANNKATPFFVYNLLLKRCKLENTRLIEDYLSNMIKGKVYLADLKVLNIVAKNYPNLINHDIIEFAKKEVHPICKHIASMALNIEE